MLQFKKLTSNLLSKFQRITDNESEAFHFLEAVIYILIVLFGLFSGFFIEHSLGEQSGFWDADSATSVATSSLFAAHSAGNKQT
jgi:hypothetical protein